MLESILLLRVISAPNGGEQRTVGLVVGDEWGGTCFSHLFLRYRIVAERQNDDG
jgi:hypothetical protein